MLSLEFRLLKGQEVTANALASPTCPVLSGSWCQSVSALLSHWIVPLVGAAAPQGFRLELGFK